MGDAQGITTAREDLLNLLASWMCTTRYGSREKTDQILAKHAHELAERQRAWLRSQGYDTDCACEGCSACLAREYIDLIDPETPAE